MAEVLDDYTFARARRIPRYATWMDGQVYRLRQGVDFYCKFHSLEQALCRVARQHGMRARIQVETEHPCVVVFQAYKREVTPKMVRVG